MASKQLLHIAVHVNAIIERIQPALKRGVTIILDRFWWSTWVYGRLDGVSSNTLDAMIGIEQEVWADIRHDSLRVTAAYIAGLPGLDTTKWQRLSRVLPGDGKAGAVQRLYSNR